MRVSGFLVFAMAIVCISAPSWADETETRTPDVCTYVARAYNNGQDKDVFKPVQNPVDIFNNGTPVKVTIFYQGNHGGYALGIGEAGKKNYTPPFEGYDPNGLWRLDRIYVVPFEGKNYVVAQQDSGPLDVTELGTGNMCRFHWTWNARVDEDHDHALCERVANEEQFKRIYLSFASDDAQPNREYDDDIKLPGGDQMTLGQTAYIKLGDSGTRDLIGEIRYMPPFPDDEAMWLAFVKEGEVSLDDQSLALLQKERDFSKNGPQVNIFPVSIDGKNYIEADRRLRYNQVTPSRELWRVSNRKVETVCSVAEVAKFEPAPAYADMAPREGAPELFTLSTGNQDDVMTKEKQRKKSSENAHSDD